MGDWSKIIYDKMPMFYGQIMLQGYLSDPAISFCAIGDATSDGAPLQVTEFGQGKEIDQLISKMYLEGGGGDNKHESYELAAYFYAKRCDLQNVELPFLFITGDEIFYENLSESTVHEVIGTNLEETIGTGQNQHKGGRHHDLKASDIWNEIKTKYNVFLVHKPFKNQADDTQFVNRWKKVLGNERVLLIVTPKAVIDVILGAIAMTSKARTLKTYIDDMRVRGQTEERIKEVSLALEGYDNHLKTMKIIHFEVKNAPPMTNPVKKVNLDKNPNEEEKKEEIGAGFLSVTLHEIMVEYHIKEPLQKLDDEEKSYKKSLKILSSEDRGEIPESLICPIIQELFFDPVVLEDGNTYERLAIELWLNNNATSPITNAKLTSTQLIPNASVKKQVAQYLQSNKHKISIDVKPVIIPVKPVPVNNPPKKKHDKKEKEAVIEEKEGSITYENQKYKYTSWNQDEHTVVKVMTNPVPLTWFPSQYNTGNSYQKQLQKLKLDPSTIVIQKITESIFEYTQDGYDFTSTNVVANLQDEDNKKKKYLLCINDGQCDIKPI